jgi:hypothetical protein
MITCCILDARASEASLGILSRSSKPSLSKAPAFCVEAPRTRKNLLVPLSSPQEAHPISKHEQGNESAGHADSAILVRNMTAQIEDIGSCIARIVQSMF